MRTKVANSLGRITDQKVRSRFMALVQVVGEHWIWQGHCDKRKGYAQFWYEGRAHWAHRIAKAFEITIPARRHVHHDCRITNCVNPQCLAALSFSRHRRRHLKG